MVLTGREQWTSYTPFQECWSGYAQPVHMERFTTISLGRPYEGVLQEHGVDGPYGPFDLCTVFSRVAEGVTFRDFKIPSKIAQLQLYSCSPSLIDSDVFALNLVAQPHQNVDSESHMLCS